MDRLGLDATVMQAENPRLIVASITGFGQNGPFSDWPAFDLVIQAMSGLMSVTGERDGKPTAVGESIADVATGMFAAWGIAAALYDRERTGVGRRRRSRHARFGVFDVADELVAPSVLPVSPPTVSAAGHPETYPVDSFATKDGDIVFVGFSDAIFKSHRRSDRYAGPAEDPRFRNNADRNVHEAELRDLIEGWAAGLTREQAVAKLREADVPAAPVWTLDELIASGHVAGTRHAAIGHQQ